MCSWEHFCRFAREPERRKVGIDTRIAVEGTAYEVDSDLAGESVLLLWELFDNELHVEFEGERTGPYYPISGPIPLSRYPAFRKGAISQKAERIRKAQSAHRCADGREYRINFSTRPSRYPQTVISDGV